MSRLKGIGISLGSLVLPATAFIGFCAFSYPNEMRMDTVRVVVESYYVRICGSINCFRLVRLFLAESSKALPEQCREATDKTGCLGGSIGVDRYSRRRCRTGCETGAAAPAAPELTFGSLRQRVGFIMEKRERIDPIKPGTLTGYFD